MAIDTSLLRPRGNVTVTAHGSPKDYLSSIYADLQAWRYQLLKFFFCVVRARVPTHLRDDRVYLGSPQLANVQLFTRKGSDPCFCSF